jgi:hypothetical protein
MIKNILLFLMFLCVSFICMMTPLFVFFHMSLNFETIKFCLSSSLMIWVFILAIFQFCLVKFSD